ncbi:GNAT family N-acetyltransferase [Streptomyces tsukubensis]|uniref:GNAT family N-acetyltransferase n=1 Tax=Streptomyces tsukubensis TaxID=83656 RepID=UPI00344BBA17
MPEIDLSDRSDPSPRIRIGRARFRDADSFVDLLSLVNPGHPVPPLALTTLALRPGRLTHGDCLCLIARSGDRVVGALIASPPRWTNTHPLRSSLVRSVLYIGGMAVESGHRDRGIATALLNMAEQHGRHAGLHLLTLELTADLEREQLVETLHQGMSDELARLFRLDAETSPATDRAATLREAAEQYEQLLTDIGTDTSKDPRYWTGVRHVITGLRRLAGVRWPATEEPQ